MSTHHGTFIWYELLTTDVAGAAAFYRDVVGWETHAAGTPGYDYTRFTLADVPTAGLMALPEDARQRGSAARLARVCRGR